MTASAASDLMSLERLAMDAEALLSEALVVSGRLRGAVSDTTLAALRRGLATAANAVNVSTASLAGAMAEAGDVLGEQGEPPW